MANRPSTMLQSFYKGVDPKDLNIFIRQNYVPLPVPPSPGNVFQIFDTPYIVPQGMMLDISSVVFFMANRVGQVLTPYPDDYTLGSVMFQLLRNEQAAWNVANAAQSQVNLREFAGTDIAGTNILELLGATEGHILLNQGDRLSATYNIIRPLLPIPAGSNFAYCRVGGIQFSIETWKRVVA